MASPASLYRQTIYWAAVTGHDQFGAITLGTVQSAPARIEPSTQVIADKNGTETVVSHAIFTSGNISLDDRVWLPGAIPGQSNQARRITRVDQFLDGRGNVIYRQVWV